MRTFLVLTVMATAAAYCSAAGGQAPALNSEQGADTQTGNSQGNSPPASHPAATNPPASNPPASSSQGHSAPATNPPSDNTPANSAPGHSAPGNNAPGDNTPGNNPPSNNAPVAPDPFAALPQLLYDLAAPPVPTVGVPVPDLQDLTSRLNAIDQLGLCSNTYETALLLQKLLKASPRVSDAQRSVFALHVIEALGNVGYNARLTIVDLSRAVQLDVALSPAIIEAQTKILNAKPPAKQTTNNQSPGGASPTPVAGSQNPPQSAGSTTAVVLPPQSITIVFGPPQQGAAKAATPIASGAGP